MTTWIVGDIHGCAEEFGQLIDHLDLGAHDTLVSCGDLFHRGPDPAGVLDLMIRTGAKFILGNHERAILKRTAMDPKRADGSDRLPLRQNFPAIDAEDLEGDGHESCRLPAERRRELLIFLQKHHGYFLRHSDLEGSPLTADGRPWAVVHAGVVAGRPLDQHSPFELTRLQRLESRGHPRWYDVYEGAELILYGHNSNSLPRARERGGRMTTLGLDTGCVYGGALTAYSPELDEFVRIEARGGLRSDSRHRPRPVSPRSQ